MTSEEAEKLLQAAVDKLGDHFDCVQILASWEQEGATRFLPRGSGNWWGRQGMAQEFINREISSDTADQIADRLNGNDD